MLRKGNRLRHHGKWRNRELGIYPLRANLLEMLSTCVQSRLIGPAWPQACELLAKFRAGSLMAQMVRFGKHADTTRRRGMLAGGKEGRGREGGRRRHEVTYEPDARSKNFTRTRRNMSCTLLLRFEIGAGRSFQGTRVGRETWVRLSFPLYG